MGACDGASNGVYCHECGRPADIAAAIVFGQWLNQTQNAAITWSNRPPEAPMYPMLPLPTRRAVATCACAGCVLRRVCDRDTNSRRRGLWRKPLRMAQAARQIRTVSSRCPCQHGQHWDDARRRFAPWRAAAARGRSAWWRQLAWHLAPRRPARVGETALTRTLIPLANFVAVPLIMSAIDKLRGGNKPRSLVTQVAVTGARACGRHPARLVRLAANRPDKSGGGRAAHCGGGEEGAIRA